MRDLFTNHLKQLVQFKIILWCNVLDHEDQKLEVLNIVINVALPANIVHVAQVNLDLLADAEEVSVLVVKIEIVTGSRKIPHFIEASGSGLHILIDNL